MASLLHALTRTTFHASSEEASETVLKTSALSTHPQGVALECLNRLATAALWLQEYEDALQAGVMPSHSTLSAPSLAQPAKPQPALSSFPLELQPGQQAPSLSELPSSEPVVTIETEELQPFELKDVVQATLVQELGLELLSKTLLLERLTHQVLHRLSLKGIETLEALAPA
jgi:hypothetical protein